MKKRNWKTAQPSSLCQSLEWSLDYARERHNLSIERVSNRMGLKNHWVLYKWVESGRMPLILVPTFEHVCGINLVSRWLASTGGKLLINLPTGRTCNPGDMQELQGVLHDACGALLSFYNRTTDADTALSAVRASLEVLSWHHGNVQQHAAPQLELGGEFDE